MSFTPYVTSVMLAIIGTVLFTSTMLDYLGPAPATLLPFATILYGFASLTISSILAFFLMGYRTTSPPNHSHRRDISRLCVFILNVITVAAMTFAIFSATMFLTHDGHFLKLQIFKILGRHGLIDTIDQAYDVLFNLALFASLLASSSLAWLGNLIGKWWTVIYTSTSQRP
ncbi:hypothetical protein DWU98_02050 [Dyella monticola]|uniref:Uncharacterized protein n=1 Tax=Dyella monticola TaxID=1927958 RepID=A0A370X8Q0_9GAMM|nr:hypothetical protein [Dyella monticola]RDS84768.1 hypothetical protein DWU98_02050 [Dyella monticola]